jgi:hypothetical protein
MGESCFKFLQSRFEGLLLCSLIVVVTNYLTMGHPRRR